MEREDLKWDKGKMKYCLILAGFLKGMAEVLTKGEINHPKVGSRPSWQLVEPEAYEEALFRHWQDYRQDKYSLDEEMGTHHMLHIAVNAMFLWWFRVIDVKKSNEVEQGTNPIADGIQYMCPECNRNYVDKQFNLCWNCIQMTGRKQ